MPKKTIVLASNNAGKLKEFNQLFSSTNIELIPQSQFQLDSIEETGLSFVENAILKARYASEKTGLPSIADDSGIEVDALQGQPGIYSARFAGEDATDQDNNNKLLTELNALSGCPRSARYQCVLVYLKSATDPTPLICQDSWEGKILETPQGDGGFGYDPLFFIPELNCSAAELEKSVKNRLSHRGKAMTRLYSALKNLAS